MRNRNMPRYGFIREPEEADCVDRTIELVQLNFGEVRFLEIGVFSGGTTAGVARRCKEIGCPLYAAGVDCLPKYKPDPKLFPELPDDYAWYEGDSMDMWRQIESRFNFLWVDGCHCVNHSMCDFLN